MTTFKLLLVSAVFCSIGLGCTRSEHKSINSQIQSDNVNNEIVPLTSLVHRMYAWRYSESWEDFPFEENDSSAVIFEGIDWNRYKQTSSYLREQEYFSDHFFNNHLRIAQALDSSIRSADITWRNLEDGIPIWAAEADIWCNCQDFPDEFWNSIKILDLNVAQDSAWFTWSWDIEPMKDSHRYRMTAIKSGSEWRISTMEGYEQFKSAKYYEDVMRN